MEAWAAEQLARARARHRRLHADREPVAGPAPDAGGGPGAAVGAARCCCSTSRRPRSATATSSGCTSSSAPSPAPGVGIVYVSHRLPEVLEVADRITVLRDGVSQGTFDAGDDVRGRRGGADDRPPARARLPRPDGPRCRRGRARGQPSPRPPVRAGRPAAVKRGEIVGIAGAEGNGQVQFLRALAGVEPSNGTVRCAGQAVSLEQPARGRSRPGSCCSAPTARRSRSSSPSACGPTPRCRCCDASARSGS